MDTPDGQEESYFSRLKRILIPEQVLQVINTSNTSFNAAMRWML